MLVIDKVSKTFADKSVFQSLNCTFNYNGIHKLSGANGSGKTTLLRLIKQILLPDQGRIYLSCGTPLCLATSYVDTNNRSFFHRLTVIENLMYFMALNKNLCDKSNIFTLAKKFEVLDLINAPFSNLSLGQMQIISIIRGLLEGPSVLLLDEALNNLDQDKTRVITDYLKDFVRIDNNLVVLCSHVEEKMIEFSGSLEL